MNEKYRNRVGKILTYDQVRVIESRENGEPMEDVTAYDRNILVCPSGDMTPYTGNKIFVRQTVAKKLAEVNKRLKRKKLCLKIAYGYRHPEIQERYFKQYREVFRDRNPSLSDHDIDSLTHNLIAVPEVGGHPTGGAVDLTIKDLRTGADMDMGTAIADFTDEERIKTVTPGLTPLQVGNRFALHDLMISAGFAPFYGEWWHFSYGDREWGAFYGEESSLYAPVDYESL